MLPPPSIAIAAARFALVTACIWRRKDVVELATLMVAVIATIPSTPAL